MNDSAYRSPTPFRQVAAAIVDDDVDVDDDAERSLLVLAAMFPCMIRDGGVYIHEIAGNNSITNHHDHLDATDGTRFSNTSVAAHAHSSRAL